MTDLTQVKYNYQIRAETNLDEWPLGNHTKCIDFMYTYVAYKNHFDRSFAVKILNIAF